MDGLLANVLIAARVLAVAYGPSVDARSGYRAALTELSVVFNAALGAFTVRKELERLHAESTLSAVFGAYALDTREIWAPIAGDGERRGLGDRPPDLAGFRELARAAAESARVRKLLGE